MLEHISDLAYRLVLYNSATIHPVFHVLKLKSQGGIPNFIVSNVDHFAVSGELVPLHLKIIDHLARQGGYLVDEV